MCFPRFVLYQTYFFRNVLSPMTTDAVRDAVMLRVCVRASSDTLPPCQWARSKKGFPSSKSMMASKRPAPQTTRK